MPFAVAALVDVGVPKRLAGRPRFFFFFCLQWQFLFWAVQLSVHISPPPGNKMVIAKSQLFRKNKKLIFVYILSTNMCRETRIRIVVANFLNFIMLLKKFC